MQNRLRITSNIFSASLGVFGKFCVFYFCICFTLQTTQQKGWEETNIDGEKNHNDTPNTARTSTFELIKFLSYSCTFVPTPWCITFLCLSNYVLKILGISTGDWKHPIQSDIHDPFNEPNCRESSNATRNHTLLGTNHISPPSRWIFGSLGPV